MNKTIEEYLKQKQKELVIYDCEKCGKHVERNGKKFRSNPHLLCKSCYMLEHYGVTSNISRPEIKEKAEQTCLERYGVKNAFGSEEIRKKSQQTLKEKTGVDNSFKDPKIIQEIREKKDYKKIQEKIQNTNLQKYGVKCTLQTEEVKEKIKQTCLEKYGSEEYVMSDDYRHKSRIKWRYKGEVFDSSWELAYWIYCEDNNIDIHRNKTPHKLSNGKNVYFDFISNGRYIEIKGDYLKNQEDWNCKLESYVKYDVKVLFEKDIVPILKYIYNRYGKEYLNKFRDKKKTDFKRKIIEVDNLTLDELSKYKNKNVRFHYICKQCKKDVYTTWHLLEHFNDNLCKYCRTHQKNELF